jgi:4-amino-4-deoxy-L-arabinose transferase
MTKRWGIPLLLLAFGLFYLLPLPFHGLWIPDETRYAQASQEMLLSGNWAAPHFMGLRYFEKPAAGYWMIAIGQAVFGENLFGVRIASALSMGLSTVLTYLIARRLWNTPRKSFTCATIYMSFGLIVGQAGYANLDPQFTLWVNLSLVALWYAIDSTAQRAKLAAWAVLGLACGMGFMTKGFLAFLLPVLIALPYMIWQRRLTEMMRYGVLAVLVAALVSLPWVLTVHMREPDFWPFFFWHEHINRFAGEDAQHAQPWWFYLPLLAVSSLPWALVLPGTFKHAWQTRSHPKIAFLLLWLVLPLAFFSLSRGKLPTYIMPCLLPLALLIGDTLIRWLEQARTGVIRANGMLNLALGLITLLAVTYLQFKQPIYDNEPLHLAFMLIALGIWGIANALQVARPSTLFLAPAVGMLALVALLPAALPNTIISNKTPDIFISEHVQELRETRSLLSNELGAASALAWHTARPDITLYDTVGETQYGFTYPDAKGRAVTLSDVQQWMTQARQKGSVGVVMRVKDDGERHEVDLLPKDGKRYEQGNIVIFIFAQTTP